MPLQESGLNFRAKLGRTALGVILLSGIAAVMTECASGQDSVVPTFMQDRPTHIAQISPLQSGEVLPYSDLDSIVKNFARDTINPENQIFKSLNSGLKVVPLKADTGAYITNDGKVNVFTEGGKNLILQILMPGAAWGKGAVPFADFSEEEMLLFARDLFKDKLEWQASTRKLTNGKFVTDSIVYQIKDEEHEEYFYIGHEGNVSLRIAYP
ncbi:MAG: hypothetical protein Q7R51_02635 [bacterium]|nr:hypothetical protein [bacterium]